MPNDYRVGQTGKIVAPQLYIASASRRDPAPGGHEALEGRFAINEDEEAPSSASPTAGLVGDLLTILPELVSA